MKETFFGYYRPDDEQFAELWKSCIFILDSTVLLNLHRYPRKAREDLLTIIKTISDRLWIPHQVGLEYQENRLNVIAEQMKRFDDVKGLLKNAQNKLSSELEAMQLKKRHSLIEPDSFLEKVNSIFADFTSELEKFEREQPDVFEDDQVRDEIDALLVDKVGSPPESQAELDEIYKEGESRYNNKQPPGYMDIQKTDTKEKDAYIYRGLVFKREYGDLVIWKEIIKKAKEQDEFRRIIFVTDDSKEDWWWIVDSRGQKIIGPRPELVDEIRSEAGVSLFYMYNSERFMEYAQQYLGIEIEKESIKQVRDWGELLKQSQLYRLLWGWEAAETEYKNIQTAVIAMMVDQSLSTLSNPVGAPGTNDMTQFPDSTGTYVLYGFVKGDKTINYVASDKTLGTYTVDAIGKVTQITTGYE